MVWCFYCFCWVGMVCGVCNLEEFMSVLFVEWKVGFVFIV